MSVYDILRQAILAKKPCVISKANEPERKICPNRIGNSYHGVMNVIYYQYEGYTTHPGGLEPDGSEANWRCNHVDDIVQATIIDEPWHEPYNKPKTRGRCVADPPDAEIPY